MTMTVDATSAHAQTPRAIPPPPPPPPRVDASRAIDLDRKDAAARLLDRPTARAPRSDPPLPQASSMRVDASESPAPLAQNPSSPLDRIDPIARAIRAPLSIDAVQAAVRHVAPTIASTAANLATRAATALGASTRLAATAAARAVPVLGAALGAALTLQDAKSALRTLGDPNATTTDKALAVGKAALNAASTVAAVGGVIALAVGATAAAPVWLAAAGLAGLAATGIGLYQLTR
jgi:hypothetical protein